MKALLTEVWADLKETTRAGRAPRSQQQLYHSQNQGSKTREPLREWNLGCKRASPSGIVAFSRETQPLPNCGLPRRDRQSGNTCPASFCAVQSPTSASHWLNPARSPKSREPIDAESIQGTHRVEKSGAWQLKQRVVQKEQAEYPAEELIRHKVKVINIQQH